MKFFKLIRSGRSVQSGRSGRSGRSQSGTNEDDSSYGDNAPMHIISVPSKSMTDDNISAMRSVTSGIARERSGTRPPPEPQQEEAEPVVRPGSPEASEYFSDLHVEVRKQRRHHRDNSLVVSRDPSVGRSMESLPVATAEVITNNDSLNRSGRSTRSRSRSQIRLPPLHPSSARKYRLHKNKRESSSSRVTKRRESRDDFLEGEEEVCINLDKADEMARATLQGIQDRVAKELDPNNADHALGCSVNLVNSVIELLDFEKLGTDMAEATSVAIDKIQTTAKSKAPSEITIKVGPNPSVSMKSRIPSDMNRTECQKSKTSKNGDVLDDFQDTISQASSQEGDRSMNVFYNTKKEEKDDEYVRRKELKKEKDYYRGIVYLEEMD